MPSLLGCLRLGSKFRRCRLLGICWIGSLKTPCRNRRLRGSQSSAHFRRWGCSIFLDPKLVVYLDWSLAFELPRVIPEGHLGSTGTHTQVFVFEDICLPGGSVGNICRPPKPDHPDMADIRRRSNYRLDIYIRRHRKPVHPDIYIRRHRKPVQPDVYIRRQREPVHPDIHICRQAEPTQADKRNSRWSSKSCQAYKVYTRSHPAHLPKDDVDTPWLPCTPWHRGPRWEWAARTSWWRWKGRLIGSLNRVQSASSKSWTSLFSETRLGNYPAFYLLSAMDIWARSCAPTERDPVRPESYWAQSPPQKRGAVRMNSTFWALPKIHGLRRAKWLKRCRKSGRQMRQAGSPDCLLSVSIWPVAGFLDVVLA